MNQIYSKCIICGTELIPFIKEIWDDRYGCPGIFAIERCPNCGQMATIPRLQESDLPELYSKYYPRSKVVYEELTVEADRVKLPGAAQTRWWEGTDNQGHYLAKSGQKVLDIGCGSCLSLLELRNLGVEAYGVEADPSVQAIAEHFDLHVHIGNIHDNPFPDEVFDLITLNQVIEHVPDPAALLQIVKKRLTEGGQIVLSFPNGDSLQRKLSGSRWINWHVPYHQHHFNRHSFTILAEQEGFEVTRFRSVTPNLWTLLQMAAMGKPPIEGDASSSWGATDAIASPSKWNFKRIAKGLLRRVRPLANPLIGLNNRFFDVLGQGDSLIVVIQIKR